MQTTFWVKIEPEFAWRGGKQIGWKAVGLTQSQPRVGRSIMLRLDIPMPKCLDVEVLESDIKVKTAGDIGADRVVHELGQYEREES